MNDAQAPTDPNAIGSAVDDALSELVNQFSDPLSFLRELIQNAIDAGSAEIEVETHFNPGAKAAGKNGGKKKAGMAEVSLQDWGGGMTREVIETKLTRLFSSAKDGDRTKIGKFGIGFVSVFAIEPDAVCVDTSRDGETWRVLFDAERRFKLLALDEPLEGTRVRVFKTMEASAFEEFSSRVRETVRYWCRFAEVEIRVDGEAIGEAFAIPAPCSVMLDDGYSRVAVGHHNRGSGGVGLYNGGLTLVESPSVDYPGVMVRAWSPHLEHTLTRDAVIRDEGYERVMGSVRQAVEHDLCVLAFERLSDELARPIARPERGYAYRCAQWHLTHQQLPPSVLERTVAHTASGTAVSVADLRASHQDDRILLTRVRGPLSGAVEATGATVLLLEGAEAERRLLEAATPGTVTLLPLEEIWALALPLGAEDVPRSWAPLRDAALTLFRETKMKVSEVSLGAFDYPGSSVADRVAIAQATAGQLTPMDETQWLKSGFLSRARAVTVNASHPTVVAVLRLARRDVTLAAYMLVKMFHLGHRLDPELDGRLAQWVARTATHGGAR